MINVYGFGAGEMDVPPSESVEVVAFDAGRTFQERTFQWLALSQSVRKAFTSILILRD